ncbi:MAG: hypothetical protein J6J66_07350 [Clostridia bacterium]|nr:hypothetical protein [Clostridia bacterium]
MKKNLRRGVAIEFAIGLMLLVIAFSILMVTTSMLQIKAVRDDLADLKESVQEMQTEEGVENNALRINEK